MPLKHSITCPNCRLPTENVICTKNLPENDGVFNQQPMLGVNLNSPYEAAKRLSRESENLLSTGSRFQQYLEKMEQLANEADDIILQNYESEF
jgi:hypothetical protein